MTEPASPQPLRVCQKCGSLTPANLPQCVQCGETSPELAAAQAEAMREAQFARAFFSRGAPFTWFFFGANIAVYVLVGLAGGPEPGVLIEFGAKVNSLIDAGEYWRLIMPIFIHGGLIHLFFNSYGLYVLGPAVEKLYGSKKFVFLYLGTGILSILASYQFPWRGLTLPSVGASGALFGLIGILTVFGFKYRDELPGQFKKAFGARLLPIILLNLMIGFVIPVIDNSAHIGGLLAGGILASFIPYKALHQVEHHWAWRGVQVLCLVAIILSMGRATQHVSRLPFNVQQFSIGLLAGQKTFDTLDALNQGSIAFA